MKEKVREPRRAALAGHARPCLPHSHAKVPMPLSGATPRATLSYLCFLGCIAGHAWSSHPYPLYFGAKPLASQGPSLPLPVPCQARPVLSNLFTSHRPRDLLYVGAHHCATFPLLALLLVFGHSGAQTKSLTSNSGLSEILWPRVPARPNTHWPLVPIRTKSTGFWCLVHWPICRSAGALSGACFGATLGGPVGAVIGCTVGAAGGAWRAATGQHVAASATDKLAAAMSDPETREAIRRGLGNMLEAIADQQSEQRNGPEAASSSSSSSSSSPSDSQCAPAPAPARPPGPA